MIDNIHNDFQPFACFMTERLKIPQKINLIIISGKRVKKSVEKKQHKIKQKNYWPVLKDTIKVEDKQKDRVELKPYIHEVIL